VGQGTQTFPQSFCPEGQTQLPLVHVCPAAQTFAQAPQFCSSVAKFTHAAGGPACGHVFGSDAGHRQLPPEHTWPSTVQTVPHAPQFVTSVCVLVHAVGQLVSGARQAHCADSQTSPRLHAFPHPAVPTPQWFGSTDVFVQTVVHSVRSPKHPHCPAWHVQPTSCTVQLWSHDPHALASFCRSRQRGERLPHSDVPGPHTHEPAEHVAPGPQAIPHPPQLLASVW
jgi:hypothetical protein